MKQCEVCNRCFAVVKAQSARARGPFSTRREIGGMKLEWKMITRPIPEESRPNLEYLSLLFKALTLNAFHAACSLTSLLLTNDRYDISAFTSQSSNVQHHLIVPAASTLLEQHILAEELRSRWISFKHRMVAENLRRFCRHWDTNQYPKQTRAECICENK